MEGRAKNLAVVWARAGALTLALAMLATGCRDKGLPGDVVQPPQNKKPPAPSSPETPPNQQPPLPIPPAPGDAMPPSSGPVTPGRYLVKFKAAFGPAPSSGNRATSNVDKIQLAGLPRAREILQRSGAATGSDIQPVFDNLFAMKLSAQTNHSRVLAHFRLQLDVQEVRIDPTVYAFPVIAHELADESAGPQDTDPRLSDQYAHKLMQDVEAWRTTQGSKNVIVAVVDTGIDPAHEDLTSNVWVNSLEIAFNGVDDDNNGYVDDVMGWNFVANNNLPIADDHQGSKVITHGTHVSGTIGALAGNGRGGAGVAPAVSIMPLKFLDSSGSGQVSDAIRAIDYAVANGAQIISNSWGGNQGDPDLENAIKRAQAKGVLFVVAAGNGGSDGRGDDNDRTPTYPASYPEDNIISVAATDQNDRLTSFSNYGSQSVDVAAPGLDILSTQNGNRYQLLSGTSMATPAVSGVLALMKAANFSADYRQLKQALLSSVDRVNGLRVLSGGRVNTYRALAAITGSPNPNPNPDPNPNPNPNPPDGGGNVAQPPMLNGQVSYRVANPFQTIAIDYDIYDATQGQAAYTYVEAVGPNRAISEPNGQRADLFRAAYGYGSGTRGRMLLTPYYSLRLAGTYLIRVIGATGTGQPVGRFSNGATLEYSAWGWFPGSVY